MGTFDGAVLHAVDNAEGGHELACGVDGDVKAPARHGLDGAGEGFGAAEDGVEGFGEARGQAPADGGLSVHRGCGPGGQHARDTGVFDQRSTIHGKHSLVAVERDTRTQA